MKFSLKMLYNPMLPTEEITVIIKNKWKMIPLKKILMYKELNLNNKNSEYKLNNNYNNEHNMVVLLIKFDYLFILYL